MKICQRTTRELDRVCILCVICYCFGVEIEKYTRIEFFSVHKLFVVCSTLYPTIQASVVHRNEQQIKWCQFLLQLFNSSTFSPNDFNNNFLLLFHFLFFVSFHERVFFVRRKLPDNSWIRNAKPDLLPNIQQRQK